jgi:hypothetical protein
MATQSQRQFNHSYSPLRYRRDVWRELTKPEKRLAARELMTTFLWSGGDIVRAQKATPKGPGRHLNFQTDEKSANYSRDVERYLHGDNLGGESRFTSKPIKDDSATVRDAVKSVGVRHGDFSGAVFKIGNRMVPRQAGRKLRFDEVDVTGVYTEERGHDRDSADAVADSSKSATLRDDIINLMDIDDHEHAAAFKLAA